MFCLSSIWKTEAFAIVQIEGYVLWETYCSAHIPASGSWLGKPRMEVSGLVVEAENEIAIRCNISV